MREDRVFRVIVLGGLALVGSPACGSGAANSSGLGDNGSSVADGDMRSELADAHDDVISVSMTGSDGGPNDLLRVATDASGEGAGHLGDADLAGDATFDAEECGSSPFPRRQRSRPAVGAASLRAAPA
jgi:hypothetical protein